MSNRCWKISSPPMASHEDSSQQPINRRLQLELERGTKWMN